MKISIKNFFLLTFILLEFVSTLAVSCPTAALIPVIPEISPSLKIKVSITVTIARRRDCDGFGICDLTIGISRLKSNSCTATIYVDDYNKSIMVLEIDKAKGLGADTYNKYFSGGTFVMEDDSPVPADLVRQLGLSGSKTLVAGRHKVVEQNGVLLVSIPVK